ncbi:MAG: hypothetical protein JWP08_630, partial [Bryobacterales bacterium]|nr:hypothetical protein [Bryobacterales bacterium]
MAEHYLGERSGRNRWIFPLLALFALLVCSRYLASTLIDYEWWSELGQLDTWLNLLLYGTAPVVLAAILFFASLATAFRLGSRHSGTEPILGVLKRSLFAKIVYLILFFVALIAANATVDNWTVVRFFGGLRVPQQAGEFVDPIFSKPLHFYFFGLPFYNMILHVLITGAILVLLVYWLAAHGEQLGRAIPSVTPGGFNFEYQTPTFREAFNSKFVRFAAALLLIGLAFKFYYNRYGLLLEDHGQFLVGVDWVADHLV